MPREQRILLVDDIASDARTLQRRLQQAGYTVRWTDNYAKAKQLLDSDHFHLAIVDISLGSPLGRNVDGLRLLADIEGMNLRGIMPAIAVTAYSERAEWIREAWLKHGAADYVVKDPGYTDVVLEKVKTIFAKQVGIKFDLEYVGSTKQYIERCTSYIHKSEADKDWPPPEGLTPQVHDLVGKLFASAESLLLREMSPGLSGSVVLRANPAFVSGLGQWFVVKIGRRDKMETEERNYRAYVKLYLPLNYATQLDSCYTRHLGALLYTLGTPDVERARDLAEFYRQKSPAQVINTLNHLFHETCSLWYRNRKPRNFANLRNLYLKAFQLKPERIVNEIKDLRPDVDCQSPTVLLEPLSAPLPNPLHRLMDEEAWWMPVSQCITHGDLNAGNMLINESGQCWLIDFYRTYPSHILRDLVVLETDLKFRVMMDALTPGEFTELEQSLIRLAPGDVFQPSPTLSASARKAGEVIAGLRGLAWDLLDWNLGASSIAVQREYLASLLMATLNVLRLRHFKEDPVLQPRRKHGLLSAALICQRLEELQ